ncbi:MAG: type II toxin-antitoxin system PemK/MazF family toxin [Saprospiraceae bacterium]
MKLHQYQIILAKLDPTIGSEIKKTRPCVIISPDQMNNFIDTIVVAPITSTNKSYPSRIKVKNSKVSGWVVLDQIRTIDKQRIIKIISELDFNEINDLKQTIKHVYID